MWRKTAVRMFQATNWQNLTGEDLDIATKGKTYERYWISPDSSKKNSAMNTDYIKAKIGYDNRRGRVDNVVTKPKLVVTW